MNTSEARSWQQSWQEQHTNPTRRTEQEKVKVKVHKRWITPGEKFIYFLFGVISIAVLMFTVSFSSSTDALNRQVQQLESQVQQQQTNNENLEHKVKEYSNPDRILRIAKENGLKVQNTQVKQATELAN
ncbi:cell division protein FtsL [Aquibacillus koreensis]|uniref:Cell division protein FtsL n=1 Tax=Aquibacillus koreensis TaxID=279446 RepID=A0A9X3WL38_9BACI|nr:cell division protein FtsL [Aquibacillus koreensis]MCT2538065.1 cell division protein FtsL [Aquibacillus koreensis]MDC3420588.1 cell division protein FtsL [Aquibacillus koreensis]